MAHNTKKRTLENPSYRPDGKDVWEEANQKYLDAMKHARENDLKDSLDDVHAALNMQFKTMAEIRNHQFMHVEQLAR